MERGSAYISGATNSSYTATTAGNYKVEVTNSTGCSKTSAAVVVTVPCRDGETISNINDDIHINVYPNPFAASFTLFIGGEMNIVWDVTIKDMLGRTLASDKMHGSKEMQMGGNLPAGIYLVEMISGESRKIARVEKM